MAIAGFEDAKGLHIRMHGKPLKAGKGKEMYSSLELSEGTQTLQHLNFTQITLFWTTDLQNCKFILF